MGARTYTGLNAGAAYKLSDHWTLMGAGGPGVQNARQQGQFDVYLAWRPPIEPALSFKEATMATAPTTQDERLLSKVPEATLVFWIVKICATTVGETGGDALSITLKLGYASAPSSS